MSKITVVLILILCIVTGVLLFILYNPKQTALITSLTQSQEAPANTADTTVSFATAEQTVQPGQTFTVTVMLHNAQPPSLAQLEIAYDPTVLTVDTIMPGTFFTNPTVDLQHIDPLTGRISYALHCPLSPTTTSSDDCVNPSSSSLAIITFSVNSYSLRPATSLSFLPKTVIRTRSGKDILQGTTSLQIPLTKPRYPISSSSAITSPGTNYLRVTPVH